MHVSEAVSLWALVSLSLLVQRAHAAERSNTTSWNYVTTAPSWFFERRGHTTVIVNDTLVIFGGRHTYFEDQSKVIGQVNVNRPPFNVNASFQWDAPYAGPYMCPYGCWGNGLCTLPGVNVNALPASALIDGTNLLNTYGLTVDAVKAFSYVSGVTTVYPFVEMITKVLGVLSFEGSGTCVCDEAYSGANCEILEKDTFLYDMTYYNITSGTWWTRSPVIGTVDTKGETWPSLRSNHVAVILQAAIPYDLPLNNSNGTALWETDQKVATQRYASNGMRMWNGTIYTGPTKPMMVVYGGVSPSCGDYCYDVWIWDFSTQLWYTDFAFSTGLLNGVADPTKGPLNRWNHAAFEFKNRMVVVFGHRIHTFLDDLWSFEAEYMTWQQIVPVLQPFPELKDLNVQCECYVNPAAKYPVAGSCRAPQQLFTGYQRTVSIGPTYRPAARMGTAVARWRDGFWMFGGYTDHNICWKAFAAPLVDGALADSNPLTCIPNTYPTYLRDIWYFNLTRMAWNCKSSSTSANAPIGRQGAAMVVIDDFLVFITGGYTNNRYFSDVWRYNITSSYWTEHVVFRGQNVNPLPRAFHTMHLWKPFQGFFVFGGYGSNSSGITTFFETDFSDIWYYNVTDCPNACNGRGKCLYSFCICDEGFFGPDCQGISCPDDYCVYDLVAQQQICQHCYGQGNCVNGMCRCFDNFDGDSCATLLCPNDCWTHGVCVLKDGQRTPSCLCNPPYGGADCQLPMCLNDCTKRGNCTISGLTAACSCNGGFAGADCSLVDYTFGS